MAAGPRLRAAIPVFAAAALSACRAMPSYTADDGQPIGEEKVAALQTFAKGQQALRAAVARSAAATASGCETEWELPFAVATSENLPHEERIAWLRVLGVDERATVVASLPGMGLAPGDKLADVDGVRADGARMLAAIDERRDAGQPFGLKTVAGASVRVAPMAVCRGRAEAAAPAQPQRQDYHWTRSVHPQEVFREDLTPDEALWVVLWTQGLAAEGGPRMKTYQYALAPLRVVLNAAALVSGAGAVARAAQSTGAAATEVGTVVAKNVAAGAAVSVAQDQAGAALTESSRNRASLEGVSWMAGTVFDKADRWSFERMIELGADPLAGFSLHRKLAAAGSSRNAFVLDGERLPALLAIARSRDLEERARTALAGAPPQSEPADILADWHPEPLPRSGEARLAAADAVDRELLESLAPMPMESGSRPTR